MTDENLDKEGLTHMLVNRYGERYKKEKPVLVDGYYFYMNMRSHGDDFMYQKGLMDDNAAEERGRVVGFYEKELQEVVSVLRRYGVKQEEIVGVGLWGSVLNVSLSKGKHTDTLGIESWPTSKILVFSNHGYNETGFSLKGDGDLEIFGIKTLGDGMQSHILMLEKEQVVEKGVDLTTIKIDAVSDRLKRWWQKEGRDPESRDKFFREYLGGLEEEETVDEAILSMISRMDLVEYSQPTDLIFKKKEEDGRRVRSEISVVTLNVIDYINAIAGLKNKPRTYELLVIIDPLMLRLRN